MLSLIKSIFSKNKHIELRSEIAEPNQPIEDSEENLSLLFKNELSVCRYIKPECHEIVIKHLTHEKSLHKTENILSNEEKKSLGLNTRVIFTQEFVAVLTKEGMELQNPKDILTEIYNKVTINKAIRDSFKKSLRVGVKKFTLKPTGGGAPCEWCISNANKEFGTDILETLYKNCTCIPYTWSYINSVIEF